MAANKIFENIKRFFIVSMVVIACVVSAEGRDPHRGYRGFLDFCGEFRTEYAWGVGKRDPNLFLGVSTSHGYQICPKAFVGVGFMYAGSSSYEDSFYAYYVHGRTDLRFGRYTPFADLRIGRCGSNKGGLYLAPSVGYRFSWDGKVGINAGLGLTLHRGTFNNFSITEPAKDDYILKFEGSSRRLQPLFSFRAGIDF